jgi:ATP-dependent RNA helicase DDX18/HAS1
MHDTELVLVLQLEKLIGKNYFLNLSAKEAYKAYVRAYDSHHLKQIFDVETLDLGKVAASFGFQVPPAVDFRILYILSECNKRKVSRLCHCNEAV